MSVNGKEAGTSLPTVFDFGERKISFKLQDGSVMVNATEMGRATGKRPSGWLRNQQTKDYLNHVINTRSANSHIGLDDLVVVVKGGTEQGTWMHEDVALEFARWVSPEFALWTNRHIKELMRTGSTSTAKGIAEEGTVNEGQAYSLVFGRHLLRVAHADGHTWIGLYGLGKLLNVPRSLRYYLVKEWFSAATHRNMGNSKDLHMINAEGFGIVLARLRKRVDERIVDAIYKQVYKTVPKNVPLLLEFPTSEAEYQFTYAQMNEIFTAVGVPPFNRGQVMKLLSNGKRA
jgi:hypothetical protein